MTAERFVRDGLTSCLPPGVPLMGQVVEAKFTGKQKAVADVTIFDGEQAKVEVSKWGRYEGAWSKRWLKLDSAVNWTGSAWERVALVQSTLF